MWKFVNRNRHFPSDVYELTEYMNNEFGDVAIHEVHKGDNIGWYLDQRLISILVSDWMKQHSPARVKKVPRYVSQDRSVSALSNLFILLIHCVSKTRHLTFLL